MQALVERRMRPRQAAEELGRTVRQIRRLVVRYRLTVAHFAPVEPTIAYFSALQQHLAAWGRPTAFYSDRHAIFRRHHRGYSLVGCG